MGIFDKMMSAGNSYLSGMKDDILDSTFVKTPTKKSEMFMDGVFGSEIPQEKLGTPTGAHPGQGVITEDMAYKYTLSDEFTTDFSNAFSAAFSPQKQTQARGGFGGGGTRAVPVGQASSAFYGMMPGTAPSKKMRW